MGLFQVGQAVAVTVALGSRGRHPADVEAALYFCCVEALQNAVKHASATSIVLGGGLDEAMLWISVTDDGVGFDADAAPSGRGILNIKDRFGSIGGGLEFSAVRGAGAAVRGYVPVVTTGPDTTDPPR